MLPETAALIAQLREAANLGARRGALWAAPARREAEARRAKPEFLTKHETRDTNHGFFSKHEFRGGNT